AMFGLGQYRAGAQAMNQTVKEGQTNRALDIKQQQADTAARRAQAYLQLKTDPDLKRYRQLHNILLQRQIDVPALDPQQKANLVGATKGIQSAFALYKQAKANANIIADQIAKGAIGSAPITIGGVTKPQAAWERMKADDQV